VFLQSRTGSSDNSSAALDLGGLSLAPADGGSEEEEQQELLAFLQKRVAEETAKLEAQQRGAQDAHGDGPDARAASGGGAEEQAGAEPGLLWRARAGLAALTGHGKGSSRRASPQGRTSDKLLQMMMAKDQDGSRDASPSIAGRAHSGNSGGSARDSPDSRAVGRAPSQGRTSDKLLQMMMAQDACDQPRDQSPQSGIFAPKSPRNVGLFQSRGAQSQGRTSDKLLQMMMAKDAM
jgi:hypothetical protein